MKRPRSSSPALSAIVAVLATFCAAKVAVASSSNYLEVCASGCAYSSVQSAITAIGTTLPASSATNVYTISIDSGVLSSDTSISTGGKSYINFVGRGMEVSIVRASLAWFQAASGGTADFFDLAGSTNLTVSNLTIDARTNDPGGLSPTTIFSGVFLGSAPDTILIDNSEILGVTYGLYEGTGNGANSIRLFNSRVTASDYGVLVRATKWFIFSSEIKCVDNGGESGAVAACVGLAAGTSSAVNTTIWGSHLHGESSVSGQTYDVAGIVTAMQSGSLTIIGSTIHVKMNTSSVGSSNRNMFGLSLKNGTHSGNTVTVNVVGSQFLYESPASLSQGELGGVGYPYTVDNLSGTVEVRLVGDVFIDAGGNGGSYRSDIVGNPLVVLNTRYEPTILSAGSKISSAVSASPNPLQTSGGALYKTVNTEIGTVTFPGTGSVSVSLPTAMPDTDYRISLSANAPETVYVSGKTQTGFTINSSNANSTASLDWIVTR